MSPNSPRSTDSHQPIRVVVPAANLAVEVRGEGPPVVLVHGFPFDHTMWRHQLAAFAHWKLIAPDLRGAGGSTTSDMADAYSMTRYADDLVATLDALAIPRAVVCGLSMGGYVIFELVRRHPGRVKGIILLDTKPDADSAEAKRARDELAVVAERGGQDAVIERLLPKLLARSTSPEVGEQVREMARRWSVPGLVGALRALRDRPDSAEVLRQVRVPTLVLVGSEDQISPPEVGRAMAALVPNARFQVVAGAGHLTPLEQPLTTTRLMLEFLNQVR